MEQPSTSPCPDRADINCREPALQALDTSIPSPLRQRPKVPGLQQDIEVLKSELQTFISEYGQEGFMPMRKQLRLHGRVDIEKAITRMGGFRKIASQMNLSLAYKQRKPKGYWDNLDNLQEEVKTVQLTFLFLTAFGICPAIISTCILCLQINRFQKSWGMDQSYMPSRKSFERAGNSKDPLSIPLLAGECKR